MDYSAILFVVFIGIFICTAAITLLGICGRLKIEKSFLNKLFYCLIVELVGAVIGLFYTTFLTTEYEVWRVFGKVAFEDNNTQDKLHEIDLEILPPPEGVTEDGRFDVVLLVRKEKEGRDFPELRLNHPKYNPVRLTLEDKWQESDLSYRVYNIGRHSKKIEGLKLIRPVKKYGEEFSGTPQPEE